LTLAPIASVAATLHGGDLVVLGNSFAYANSPAQLFVFTPATQNVQTLTFSPALTTTRDMAVLRDGTVIVADAVNGLLRVDPANGQWTVVAPSGAFPGGSAPTAIEAQSNGDLLAAGPDGVTRLAQGQGAPQVVSNVVFSAPPSGVTSNGGADIWVSTTLVA